MWIRNQMYPNQSVGLIPPTQHREQARAEQDSSLGTACIDMPQLSIYTCHH